MKTELETIMAILEREGVRFSYSAANGVLYVNGARLFFKPDGELTDIRD